MYTNVSAEFLTALQRPSRHFAARFKDNGTVVDLEVKHIKAHFGSCGAGSLAVGCAFSSYIEVTANRTDILLEGKELFLEIGLLLPDDSYEYVPFGYWTVQKPTKTKDSMSFQAVDRMNGSFNAEYETELTYPATVAAVLSEFTTKTGITVHCSLQTSTVMIAAPIVGTQRNALSIIAATLLGNAWIDRNGEIQITTIGGGTVVEVNYDYVKTQPEMDEEPTVIEGVKVYTVEGQTDTWIERGTGNQVTVSDVYMTDANLDIVKNNVIGLTYGGGTVSFMGNPLLDPSDIIKFRGGIEMEEYMLVTETNANLVSSNGDELAALAYESYEVPCMDIVQDFDGGLLTTVTATGQFEDTENTIAPAPMASELARQASAISSAQQTADNAVVLANGKNKIFYQDDAPTTGMSVGDMWFDTNGGNAIYEYKSTGWVIRQLGQGSLAANSVTAVEINVATLSAITANIGTVTAGVLRSSDYQAPTGSSVYSTAGMIIDLNNKVIRTPKTAILSDGSIYSSSVDLTGKITATSGKIGPWTIGTNAIYNTLTSMTDASHDGTYLGTDGIKMVAGSQTVWNALVANSTWSYIESANDVVGIRMVAWPDGSSGLYEYDVPGGNLSTLWLRSGTTLSTDFHLWVGSDVDSYVNILKSGTIALSAPTGGKIEFCYDGEIPATASIYESARGRLTLTGHATLDLPLTGGTLSGSVAISATGKGFNLTDASGTTYGGLYENGNNLWIGAASSTSPHHRGAQGNTYISAGYSTSSGVGNSTIYISVPSLSGTTWSHTAYGVLHSGNYSSYALPLSGGTLTGNVTVGQTTDTVSRGVTVRNSLGNVGLSVGTDGSHGLYSGTKGGFLLYATKDANSTNSTLYVPRPLTVSGLASVGNNVIATASDTSERYFRAVNSNGSIELNAAQYNKGVYDRSGGRWIMYLATNSTADTSIKIPRGVQIGEADINGFIELYHATPYIDFHFDRSTADYTYRIMETSSGTLWFSGSQSVAGNITVSTTSTSVERAVTVSTGNVSGAVRANNGGTGGAFGLYVTKTGGTARTGTWLSAMDNGGTYHANWTSDRREKNLIGLMSDQEAETLLRNIDIINFSYKSDQNQIVQNGMIAQQMRDVLKENGIGYRSYLNITATHDDDFIYDLNAPEADVRYGIDYARLTPILWKGWQLHDERIAALEAEIKALKGAA